jgi:putative transposase
MINSGKNGHHALRKGRVSIANGVYLITTTTLGRQKLFADFAAGCAVSKCIEDGRLLGDAKMLAWVLMPDHLHGVLQLGDSDKLGVVVNRLKSASARHANRVLRRKGGVWTKAFHDHALRSDEDLQDIARYVVANPVRAELVTRVGNYPFWNAVWLA